MAKASKAGALLRERVEHQHARVSYVELFFNLVFVFAITQISHTLLEPFSPLGVAQAGWYLLSHLVGLGLLALLTPARTVLPPLGFSFAATAILILAAAWEALSLRPKEA